MIGQLIDLPKIIDMRGNLTVVEQMRQIPFDIARVYWTYDIPGGGRRGGHAHRTCQEVVVAVSGSFDVQLYMEDFSSGAVCLVLASELFDEDEYIYDMDEFEKLYASCLI